MIKVLDSFVADKIAAGEVIERPVSAVKELVENSIDAGASSIIVEIRGGGKSYIRVTDDGCGIPSEEAETAFLRHATSKISAVTDLDSISSLGFRGEALASIAAVSRLTMVTRTADSNSGLKLVLHAGQLVSSEVTGANIGTSVICEDLFYNTPARRKFMKSDAREASAITELIQQFAVFYSSIRFMMISNGNTLFSTSGDGDVIAVLKSLYPEYVKVDMIPLSSEQVKGFISGPGDTRSTRRGEFFFVNGRLVSSDIIEDALIEGYGGRIFSGFPVAVLFIEADPSETDVNIHPGKREIRFLKATDIKTAISSAVADALVDKSSIPGMQIRQDVETSKTTESLIQSGEQSSIRDYLKGLERNETLKADTEPATPPEYVAFERDYVNHSVASENPDNNYSDLSDKASSYDIKKDSQSFDFSELVYKGYVFDTYIIMQGAETLYIFDQHAAHERIFYEKFMAEYRGKTHLPQPLLTSFTVNVGSDVYSMDRGWLEELRNIGFDIEDFGSGSFMIRGIPEYMTPSEAEGFARSFIEGLGEGISDNQTVIDKLILRSCKSAVKANDKLTDREISELMDKLSKCENPYACPHGRPTFIKLTNYEIERSFRRK